MSAIRILAIEDEPLQAEGLRVAIEDLGYTLIEVTPSLSEFQRLVVATVPDILLIDIDLGAEIDGIQLAEKVKAVTNIPTIFLTASRDKETILRAVRDSKASAYITKPYEATALQAAIEIAVQNLVVKNETISNSPTLSKSLFVKHEGRLKKVNVDEIQFVEVKEKFCSIQSKTEKTEVNIRLKDLLDQLPSNLFLQVHRSFVIAINHISEVTSENVIINNTQVPIGKNYKDDLMKRLNKIG